MNMKTVQAPEATSPTVEGDLVAETQVDSVDAPSDAGSDDQQQPKEISTIPTTRLVQPETVSLDAQPPVVAEVTEDPGGLKDCPKCRRKASWGAASWCPNCGYYPELDGIIQSNAELQKEPEEGPAEVGMSAEEKYRWILVTLGGVGVALCLSMAVRVYFYYNDGPRGLWTIVQTSVGLGCFATGQLMATLYAMSKSTDISLIDAVNRPLTVWGRTTEELPLGARRIYIAVWGLSIALSAMLCIGVSLPR